MASRGPPEFRETPLLWLQHALSSWTAEEKRGLARSKWFAEEGRGYNLQQSTKPSTIGFAFADSPVALLAWVYEKLHDWTDSYPWTDDEILTWVSVYVFANAGPEASARIYYEVRHGPTGFRKGTAYNAKTPLGISQFPRDIQVIPRLWTRALGPVVFEKRHESGGHFAAYERPKELVEDLQTMFGRGGGAYSIAKSAKL